MEEAKSDPRDTYRVIRTAIKNAVRGIGTITSPVESTSPANTAIPLPPLNLR